MIDTTIIVTTCDRPGMLIECLASIKRAGDMRILVVDDSNSGNGRGVAETAGVDYTRTAHIGTSRARLVGLEWADTPFVAFFDDDDYMLDNWYRLHVAPMPNADVVTSDYYDADANLRPTKERRFPQPSLPDLLACRVTVNDGSLIRRSVLESVTWHPERDDVMMLSLWLELATKGVRFVNVTEPTWLYRWHGTNKSYTVRTERDAEQRREAIAEYAR